MNKIILIFIIFSFILTGCSLYEIEDYSVVAGIGIDYQDEIFTVTLEIYIENEGQTTKLTSEIKEGKGKVISEAFNNITLHMDKYPFINHCSIIILNESILKEKFDETIDYLLHDVRVRSSCYILSTSNQSANEILLNSKQQNRVIADEIVTFFERKKQYIGIWSDCKFNKILDNKLSNIYTIILPSIKYDNECDINGVNLINNYNDVIHCSNLETFYIQLFNNNLKQGLLSNDLNYAYLKKCIVKTKLDNKKYNINISLELLPYDYIEHDMHQRYTNEIKEEILKEMEQIFKKLTMLNFDPFYINKYLYQNCYSLYQEMKDNYYEYLQNIDINIEVYIKILTSGLSEKRG